VGFLCFVWEGGEKHAVREERSLGDETAVYKDVVITVDVPVDTTLNSAAEE